MSFLEFCLWLTLYSMVPGHRVQILIGASLSEPHINGTAVRELYIYLLLLLLWYVGHAKLYSQ